MERIELEVYEKKDIIEYLKYAREQKKANKKIITGTTRQTKKFDTTKYDVERITNLIKILGDKEERIHLTK